MSGFYISILLFIYNINAIEMAFVSIGNYPNHKKFDVNSDECGLRYLPRQTIPVNKTDSNKSQKCIHNPYENRFYEKQRISSDILTSKRIYMGQDVELNESPWTVYLSFHRSNRELMSCTGSLITFEWVVTAAHCFDRNYDRLLVSGGTNQPMKGQIIEANKTTLMVNANYTSDRHYDIAVIKLMSKFTRHKNYDRNYLVNTICLPEIRENNDSEQNVTVFGYGFVNSRRKATQMQKTDMILDSSQPNYRLLVSTLGDTPTNCLSDSGGPLVQYLDINKNRTILVAIVKGGGPGTGCSQDIDYNYFVPVFKNIDWILQTISNI